MSGMPYQNRTANSQRVVRGASKTTRDKLQELVLKNDFRKKTEHSLSTIHRHLTGYFVHLASRGDTACIIDGNTPKEVLYCLESVDNLSVTKCDLGWKISWAAGK